MAGREAAQPSTPGTGGSGRELRLGQCAGSRRCRGWSARLPAWPGLGPWHGDPRHGPIRWHDPGRARGAAVLHAVDDEVGEGAIVCGVAVAVVVVVGVFVSLHVKGDHVQRDGRQASDVAALEVRVVVWEFGRGGARAAVGDQARRLHHHWRRRQRRRTRGRRRRQRGRGGRRGRWRGGGRRWCNSQHDVGAWRDEDVRFPALAHSLANQVAEFIFCRGGRFVGPERR